MYLGVGVIVGPLAGGGEGVATGRSGSSHRNRSANDFLIVLNVAYQLIVNI